MKVLQGCYALRSQEVHISWCLFGEGFSGSKAEGSLLGSPYAKDIFVHTISKQPQLAIIRAAHSSRSQPAHPKNKRLHKNPRRKSRYRGTV